MKNAPEPEEDRLLDAVLADDDWLALGASLKQQSLLAMRSQRRMRRWVGGGMVCALVLAVLASAWRLERPAVRPSIAVQNQPGAAKAVEIAPKIRHLTNEETLALFPKGDCTIAEINGRQQLIFFDAKQAEQGFLLSGH